MKTNKKIMMVFSLLFVLFIGIGFSSISSAACPGDGPAKPVSNVTYLGGYVDEEDNHIYMTVGVMGYGTDYVFINGDRVRPDTSRTEFIVLSCTGADGFVYHFDCGPAIKGKTYTLEGRFESLNHPYNSMSFSHSETY